MFNRLPHQMRPAGPAICLAACLAGSLALALLPPAHRAPLKDTAATVLRPAQQATAWLGRRADRLRQAASNHWRTCQKLARAQAEIRRLRRQREELARRIATLRRKPDDTASPDCEAAAEGRNHALLRPKHVAARPLGWQARAFLARRQLLDVGLQDGVQAGGLVLVGPQLDPLQVAGAETPASASHGTGLVDRGEDYRLRPGALVLGDDCVLGKIAEVGAHASSVVRVTDVGYRDLVQLAGAPSGEARAPSGPQGILEGVGQKLARIRLVDVTEPVAVGEAVYATSARGVVDYPPLYGRVAKVRRAVGAAHWEIWMEPAAAPPMPPEVAVLVPELNPARVGRAPRGSPSAGSDDDPSNMKR